MVYIKMLSCCCMLSLTNCGDHCTDEVERAGEIPSWSEHVHTDAGHVRLLVMPEKLLQVAFAQVMSLAKLFKPLSPPLLGLFLFGMLKCRENSGSTEQVDDNQKRQHHKPCVILIHWTEPTATRTATCHYVIRVEKIQSSLHIFCT